ncbi:ABC transporter substrate-binding protein [Conexibacter woesei]|uniref:Extracellular solute-binding protein family 5 n=1 Tax=Conexibacter woesei (strain DSM 14684 / CCUG 47730 / CIP 108061 / JCM 11494 / NBRC 100937 / ID131577) TaxID=469383 RepID=D3F6I0_CONWI|nr:ABC transporter substrate-binding protein [Conexibacter woesei]ADB50747.1 extracellular solute-binding protein family 5 [Conexibacter woesei DSM 14684]
MRTSRVLAALACIGGLVAAGCGSATTNSDRPLSTLRVPFQSDVPGGVDPDVFYDVEGLQITNSAYEGLLGYADDGRLVGELATDWRAGADGRTYDFTLRPGVRFSDGTPFDAQAMKASFERRRQVDAGPAYMLADVEQVEALSPRRLRVRLSRPNAAFLDHLASPYGPKAVSPTAVQRHARDGDLAKGWLQTHTAGTGAYELTEAVPGQRFVMRASPTWRRSKPTVREVQFTVVPDAATQVTELRGGQLDLITHGLTTADVQALRGAGGAKVTTRPSTLRMMLYLNTAAGTLRDAEVRRAFLKFVDRDALVDTVYGDLARASDSFYPDGTSIARAAPLDVPVDPDQLRALSSRFTEPLVIGAVQGDGPAAGQIAQLLQGQLQQAGIKATTRDIPLAQVYDLTTRPSARPDVLIVTNVPDDLAPDSWSRVYLRTGGSVNWLSCSVPEADRLIDEAVVARGAARQRELGVEAAAAWMEHGCVLPLAELQNVTVSRKGVENVKGGPARPFAVDVDKLRQAR